jgi:hypothetical protein
MKTFFFQLFFSMLLLIGIARRIREGANVMVLKIIFAKKYGRKHG